LYQIAPFLGFRFPLAVAELVAAQFSLQSLTFLLQLLQGGLTAFELFFQSRLNALRLLGFLINALGIDKTDFLYAIRRRLRQQHETRQGYGEDTEGVGYFTHDKNPCLKTNGRFAISLPPICHEAV
jgi:hypothetical protein